MSLEPFIRTIMSHPDIFGIQCGETNYRIGVYAEDMICYLTKPAISIPNLLKAYQDCGNLSNLKTNYTKSVANNIDLPRNEVIAAKDNFPFKDF